MDIQYPLFMLIRSTSLLETYLIVYKFYDHIFVELSHTSPSKYVNDFVYLAIIDIKLYSCSYVSKLLWPQASYVNLGSDTIKSVMVGL